MPCLAMERLADRCNALPTDKVYCLPEFIALPTDSVHYILEGSALPTDAVHYVDAVHLLPEPVVP
jgi:hypothetical protein